MSAVRALATALLLLLLAPSARAEDDASPFRDQAALDEALGAACDGVEAALGEPFRKRPTVRVSDAATVGAILAREFESFPEAVIPAASRAKLASDMAELLMAKYEPGAHVIHILPATVDLIHELQPDLPALGAPHLRVLLAHEAAHAHDFERHDFMAMRKTRQTPDEHQALNAVVEGHAQYVALRVARAWKLTDAFDRLTLAIVGADDEQGTATQRALRAAALTTIRFAYSEGHAFFEAVDKARGAEAVAAALREPPTSSRDVERPERWLDPHPDAKEPDLGALIDTLRPIVGTDGWRVVTARVLEAALHSQAIRLPEDRRADYLRGFRNAHALQAAHKDPKMMVSGVLLWFDSAEDAQRLIALDRLMAETLEPQPGMTVETKDLSDGVGKERAIPGFTLHRIVHAGGDETDVRQLAFHAGRFVVELVFIDAGRLAPDGLDAVVAHAHAVLSDPDAASKRAAPAPVTILPEAAEGAAQPARPDGPPKKEPVPADPGK